MIHGLCDPKLGLPQRDSGPRKFSTLPLLNHGKGHPELGKLPLRLEMKGFEGLRIWDEPECPLNPHTKKNTSALTPWFVVG